MEKRLPGGKLWLQQQDELGQVGYPMDVWGQRFRQVPLVAIDPNPARIAARQNGRFCIYLKIITHVQTVGRFLVQLARGPLEDGFAWLVYPHFLANGDLCLGNDIPHKLRNGAADR